MNITQRIEDDQRRMRREVLLRHLAYALRSTIQLRGVTPDTNVDDVRVEFTDASARVLAPFAEAVEILEAIIFASDGCIGHRECAHSMEPWQRARALLEGKWQAENEGSAYDHTAYFEKPSKSADTAQSGTQSTD